ncbi:MAG TPA: hypothetical protein VIM27_10560 [Gaiellales bacterium]|jgi:hypothetical protein
MTSKVDTPLKLSADGVTVQVTGPILKWESDERSAVFSVEITQPPNGARVSARGQSTRTYHPNDEKWQAVARVSGPTRLQLGPALATATATITLEDGTTELYSWPVDVVLTDHLPHTNDPRDAVQPITADG